MGIDALDWSELIAWADKFYSETDIEWLKPPNRPRDKPVPVVVKYCTLPDIDLQIIRQMSQEYCWMASEASDPRCMCPIEIDRDVEISEDDAEVMAQSLLDNLRAMGFLDEDGQSI